MEGERDLQHLQLRASRCLNRYLRKKRSTVGKGNSSVLSDSAVKDPAANAPSATANAARGEPPPHRHSSFHPQTHNESSGSCQITPHPPSRPAKPLHTLSGTPVFAMPEKGWRKRLQGQDTKRPKTPVQAKAAAVGEDVTPNDDQSDRTSDRFLSQPTEKHSSSSHGWRKTYLGSRPQTPIPTPTVTSRGDDTEDSRSETSSDPPTGRGRSAARPKFTRYMSDYLLLTAPPKPLVKELTFTFSEPWAEDTPFDLEPPVDPELAVQAIRSHIAYHASVPLPVEHNSGLLSIFEDYRKVREEKERLDVLMKGTLEDWGNAQEKWSTTESQYLAEMRRLELLIARGTTGMTGLIKARQGTVVDRRRVKRKSLSTLQPGRALEFLSGEKLDEQIKQQSQKVIYHKPSSPSGPMAALSKRFMRAGSSEELHVGTPPDGQPETTLTRKVKSELNLMKMGTFTPSVSTSQSANSGQSFSTTSGDPLPDEVGTPAEITIDIGVESEAFVALRELATLVARRRGIDAETFVSKFMLLYSTEDRIHIEEERQVQLQNAHQDTNQGSPGGANEDIGPQLSKRRLRHFQSQPQLTADKNRRRHFSFEPGDDELGMLSEELRNFELNRPRSPAGSQSTASSEGQGSFKLFEHSPPPSLSRTQTLGAEAPKPTKIPSPLNRPSLSRTRRENSTSSLQTVRHTLDDRRDSRSSVLTAFRENSSGSLRRPQSTSRSNSFNNLHQTENENPRGSNGSLKVRNSVVALAAARAASASKTNSPGKNSNQSPCVKPSRARKPAGASRKGQSSENNAPHTRG